MSTGQLLRVRDLQVLFPIHGGVMRRTVGHVHAVNGVSLEIGKSEIVSVVGESGCGKSTLGLALLGLVKVTAGDLWLEGEALDVHRFSSWKRFRRDFQIIFQDPYSSLNPRHTIYEILSEPLIVHKLSPRRELRDRVASLLDRVGLSPDYMDRYPHAFSGGQRQRINIARALGLEPRVLICDEIVSALDVSVQAQIINLLLDLKQELGLSLLFISHDLSLVRAISDHIHVMYLGRVVEHGTPQQLFEAPAHHYTRALLRSIPGLDRSRRPILLEGEVPSAVNLPTGCAFYSRCPARQSRCQNERPTLELEPGGSMAACFFPAAPDEKL
ncbi:MAG: ATP-binding cassette domain-containing protein [Leptospiraceae bacterium]|nr:ATP-binding cassette domain-containing protein [Leptospiraceae bacterium]